MGSARSIVSEGINFIYDPYSNDICILVQRANPKTVRVISKNLPMYFCFFKGDSSAYTLAKLSKNVSHLHVGFSHLLSITQIHFGARCAL